MRHSHLNDPFSLVHNWEHVPATRHSSTSAIDFNQFVSSYFSIFPPLKMSARFTSVLFIPLQQQLQRITCVRHALRCWTTLQSFILTILFIQSEPVEFQLNLVSNTWPFLRLFINSLTHSIRTKSKYSSQQSKCKSVPTHSPNSFNLPSFIRVSTDVNWIIEIPTWQMNGELNVKP